jgi:hypothetical protein
VEMQGTFLVPLSYLRRGSISVVVVWYILCVFPDDIRRRTPTCAEAGQHGEEMCCRRDLRHTIEDIVAS